MTVSAGETAESVAGHATSIEQTPWLLDRLARWPDQPANCPVRASSPNRSMRSHLTATRTTRSKPGSGCQSGGEQRRAGHPRASSTRRLYCGFLWRSLATGIQLVFGRFSRTKPQRLAGGNVDALPGLRVTPWSSFTSETPIAPGETPAAGNSKKPRVHQHGRPAACRNQRYGCG
jgi:hypothetical protein